MKKITKQIVVKLNESRFRPLMDKLGERVGEGVTVSDSDMVAKCLFFCQKVLCGPSGENISSEDILAFLADFKRFKENKDE